MQNRTSKIKRLNSALLKENYFFNTKLFLQKGNNINFFQLMLLLQVSIIDEL